MLSQTSVSRAAIVASQIGQQANAIVTNHLRMKADGLPAQGTAPAVTAQEYATAIGTAGMSILDAIAAANPQS